MEAQLFTTTQIQKVPFGTGESEETDATANTADPKTVLCVYFKAGTCSKGENTEW
jgi:hypothetical protein